MMPNIIGYIHICQKGEWRRSFDMLYNCIKNYGLYENTSEIRVGIVNDTGVLIEDYRLKLEKIKIVYIGKSEQYERPTLLNMRSNSEIDPEGTLYWYLHTKGLRHFNTPKESFVVDWIKLMLYWNIQKWRLALEKLKYYDTYGCNDLIYYFYSGNFWWAKASHIKELPKYIKEHYTAPEEWILTKHDKMISIFRSNLVGEGHYLENYPPINYMTQEEIQNILPENFNIDIYMFNNPSLMGLPAEKCLEHYLQNRNSYIHNNIKNLSNVLPDDFDIKYYKSKYDDLKGLTDEELINHWFTNGKNECRVYRNTDKVPDGFDFVFYRTTYLDLKDMSDEELIKHWTKHGQIENRLYRDISKLPIDFDFAFYKETYSDLKDMSNEDLETHWLKYGMLENRIYKGVYKFPNDFDFKFYRSKYDDLKNMTDEELKNHWMTFGRSEWRVYK